MVPSAPRREGQVSRQNVARGLIGAEVESDAPLQGHHGTDHQDHRPQLVEDLADLVCERLIGRRAFSDRMEGTRGGGGGMS